MKSKAIILTSGGLDSTTCLAIAKNQGFECHSLSFHYGQKHHAELNAAKRIANTYGAIEHRVITLPIDALSGSSLTDASISVPDFNDNSEIPSTYVPARNTLFLAFALSIAETIKANSIFIGVSSIDYSGYPDCRPEYIKAFQNMANLATKTGINNQPIIIQTPLIKLSKAETIQLGVQLGVDYKLTVSCYRANSNGEACGQCDSCEYRRQGFKVANLADPTRYY